MPDGLIFYDKQVQNMSAWGLFQYQDCLSEHSDSQIYEDKIDSLVQDCSSSIADTLELLQSCT